MFVKSVLRDSFKELSLTLKDPKIVIVFTIYFLLNSFILKFFSGKEIFLILIIWIPLMSFLYTFLTQVVLKIININDKKIDCNNNFSFGMKFLRCLFSCIKIRFITAIVMFIIPLLSPIIDKIGNSFLSLVIIFGIIITILVRTSLYVPISILDDAKEIIRSSFKMTKGNFWKLAILNLIPLIFLSLIFIIQKILNLSLIMSILISFPFGFINVLLLILIPLNSWYYLKKEELQTIIVKES